jgi:drug/metabolite transporter (DMT)-like permease
MFALSPLALTLSIACALALAGADYFRKAVPHTVPTEVLLFYFFAGQLPLIGAWLAFDAFTGNPSPLEPLMTAAYWRPGFPDVVASLAGNTLFIVAVRRSPIGLVVPLLSLLPVFTLVLGAILLGELPTVQQSFGIALTAAGVFCVYQPEGIPLSPRAVWHRFRAEPGAAPMLCVAMCWALTAPLDKMAMAQASVASHALAQVGLLSIAVFFWAVSQKQRGDGPANPFRTTCAEGRMIAAASVSAGLSYAFQLGAYQLTLVAFVEALKRSVEIAVVLMIGAVFLNERLTRHKVIGVGLIVCGVPLTVIP